MFPWHDPRLSLYTEAEQKLAELTEHSPAEDTPNPTLRGISLLERFEEEYPFADPVSSFEATSAQPDIIEHYYSGAIVVGMGLFKEGIPYIREEDRPLLQEFKETRDSRAPHLVVLVQEGPPALVHNEFFFRLGDDASKAMEQLKYGRAEVLGIERAAVISQFISSITLEMLDHDYF